MAMSSSKPYMVRALYEWILDNECTPHILVNAMAEGVSVPQQFVENGQIILNISPAAVVDLSMTNEAVHFNGRFGGVPMDVFVPMYAVMGIYARENGQGMVFDATESPDPGAPPSKPKSRNKPVSLSDAAAKAKNKPGLKIVK